MFFEFFMLWGMWWWILVGALIFADIFFLEYDNGTGATVSLIVFALASFFFGNWNPFPWMAANPLWTIGVVFGYFAAGTVWSVVKWYFHCLNIRDRYNEIKEAFFEEHNIITGDKVPITLKEQWGFELRAMGFYNKSIPPKASEHKGTILTWMTHWPFSAVWTLLNDPIRRIFRAIYKHMAGMMQKISNSLFASTVVEFDEGDDDDSGQPSGKGWQRS